MPKRDPVLFKRSIIAIAVLSVSACSSLPQVSSIDLGNVGDGIAKAGKATANATRNTWKSTVNLFGFGDPEDGQLDKDQSLSDDVLLAGEKDTDQKLPIELVPVIKIDEQQRSFDAGPVTVAKAESPGQPTKALIPVASLDGSGEGMLHSEEGMLLEDESGKNMRHEVVAGETLWKIARETTGDSQNWHVLLDFNNLQPDATVFPGQQLLVPGQLAIVQDATAFHLDKGETLWQFAKRTTGDALNWRAIARHNRFTEEQSVTVYQGQTIFVPESLVVADSDVAVISTVPALDAAGSATIDQELDTENTEPVVAAEAPASSQELAENQQQATNDTSMATATIGGATNDLLTDHLRAMAIIKANYSNEDLLKALDNTDSSQVIAENANIDAVVQVSGTYYPKAVYNHADLSSSLLTRVPPGTVLKVSKSLGTWYEVDTDAGVGYVHQRDIN